MPVVNILNAGAAVSGWTPADIASIDHWYKASLETYANNDLVDSFHDQIGSADLEGTGSQRPVFKTNSGDPYIEFNGVDNVLMRNPAWPPYTDCTLCMVYSVVADAAAFSRFWGSYTWENVAPGSNDFNRFTLPDSTNLDLETPSRPTALLASFLERGGTNARYRFNSTEDTATVVATPLHEGVAIGGAIFGGNFANIRVVELFACSSVLSPSEYTNLEEYLLAEYGVTL